MCVNSNALLIIDTNTLILSMRIFSDKWCEEHPERAAAVSLIGAAVFTFIGCIIFRLFY